MFLQDRDSDNPHAIPRPSNPSGGLPQLSSSENWQIERRDPVLLEKDARVKLVPCLTLQMVLLVWRIILLSETLILMGFESS